MRLFCRNFVRKNHEEHIDLSKFFFQDNISNSSTCWAVLQYMFKKDIQRQKSRKKEQKERRKVTSEEDHWLQVQILIGTYQNRITVL